MNVEQDLNFGENIQRKSYGDVQLSVQQWSCPEQGDEQIMYYVFPYFQSFDYKFILL